MLSLQKLKESLTSISNPPKVLIDNPDQTEYEEARQVFNRRFSKRPAAIVYCTSTEQVAHVVNVANANKEYPLRVKSGGHDHEAESSETGAILIDFKHMNNYEIDTEKMEIRIEPGIRFKDIIPDLDRNNVSIPHGTCETVGVFGFTLGGGWGPWTRLHGMCCEHLVEATLILGGGQVRIVKDGIPEDQELLWALRGGGGFSYGVLTEIKIKLFQQPKHTLRFNVNWHNHYGNRNKILKETPPAIQILKAWEDIIAPDRNPQLIGTNLKIMAIPQDDKSIEDSQHDCICYGYYAGTKENLENDLKNWFNNVPFVDMEIHESDDNKHSFSSWDRISTHNNIARLQGRKLTHFPPDLDDAAPHKISCRMVQEKGLGESGRYNLIESLRSHLITKEGILGHLHTYVTLGAISGNYYSSDFVVPDFPQGCSFPYQKRPYTIQYQAWWNEKQEDKDAGIANHVYKYTNKALDWIAECRTKNFPETEGSFISFKDSAIPTHKYFLGNYEKLQEVKHNHSKDETNLFQSRKTII